MSISSGSTTPSASGAELNCTPLYPVICDGVYWGVTYRPAAGIAGPRGRIWMDNFPVPTSWVGGLTLSLVSTALTVNG